MDGPELFEERELLEGALDMWCGLMRIPGFVVERGRGMDGRCNTAAAMGDREGGGGETGHGLHRPRL